MLTRLKVNGFKNLVDVDIRFGPFTCIAGVNGSGKSNLFDAIRFLAALAEKPLVEAALSVRGPGGTYDIRSLFHQVGDQPGDEMSFEAEMIVPAEGADDLGQPIQAGTTFLRYCLKLAYTGRTGPWPSDPFQILSEELVRLPIASFSVKPSFSTSDEWRESTIYSDAPNESTVFSIRQGQMVFVQLGPPPYSGQGESMRLDTRIFPRTVLSSQSIGPVASNPTVILARQEMRSWRVLHLDPTAMRRSSYRSDPPGLQDDGYGFVRLLHAMAETPPHDGRDPDEAETAVYARVAGAIWDLLGEVSEISVAQVNERGELELTVTQRGGTRHSVRALSDGTLRFLALAVLRESETPGLYCVEEPENGIHPGRIRALLDLLQAVAVDTRYPIEEGNPLRQVIISTHSPSVVMRVPADSLVVAELWPSHDDRGRFKRARFRGLAGSWRDPSPSMDSLAFGTLLEYLNPEGYRPLPKPDPERGPEAETRVMDHARIRRMLSPSPPD